MARALAKEQREVLVLEREGAVGTGVSSRNSEGDCSPENCAALVRPRVRVFSDPCGSLLQERLAQGCAVRRGAADALRVLPGEGHPSQAMRQTDRRDASQVVLCARAPTGVTVLQSVRDAE